MIHELQKQSPRDVLIVYLYENFRKLQETVIVSFDFIEVVYGADCFFYIKEFDTVASNANTAF